MKIIVVSDMVAHTTGYGVTAKKLCLALKADGHTVYNFAPGAFHMANLTDADGIRILGSNGMDDRWGNNTLPIHVRNLQPDLIITWLDPQGLNQYGLDGVPTYIWAPIDSWPVPEQEMSILGRADRVIASSQWGQTVLAEQHLPADYIPCGIDMQGEFYIDPAGRKEWRDIWGFKDGEYVVGMVGMNAGSPDRKGYGYAFDVMAQFHAEHPNSRFYIHTNPASDGSSLDLNVLAKSVGLQDVVRFPEYPGPGGWPSQYMRHVYNGIDVLLHTSLTEGFGLPVVEAQACGTPVVFNSATSVTELVPEGNGYGAAPLHSMWVGTVTRIAVPDAVEMLKQLNRARNCIWNHEAIRSRVMQYDFPTTYEQHWKPLLAVAPQPLKLDDSARKLRLGAGSDNDPSFVNHDKEKFFPHIDVAHDLEVFPWPWDDSSFDYIEMSDVIEHMHANVTQIMDELWRITAPGGLLMIHTVKAGSWQHTQDPTHTRGFEMNSFDYYDPQTDWGKQYRYSDREWEIVKRTIEPKGGVMAILRTRKMHPTPEWAEPLRDEVVA